MTLHATARAVAAELPGWRHAPRERAYEHIAYVQHETGAEACLLRFANRAERIEIHGVFPKLPNGSIATPWMIGLRQDGQAIREPRITVAADRDPADIARDFRRRFETAFLDVWHRCAAYATRSTVEDDRAAQICADLVAMAPSGWVHEQDRRRSDHHGIVRFADGEHERWSGRVTVSAYRDTVDLDLHGLTPDEARRVVAALREP